MNYINFNNSLLENIEYNENKLITSSFNYIEKMKNIKFNNNDLRESEFINTPLKDIDLSNSNIEGIKVNPTYLKGLTVNTYQAIDLSKLLGINIR